MADKLNLPTSIVVSCCLFRKQINYCVVCLEQLVVECSLNAFFVNSVFRIDVIHCLNKYTRRSRLKAVATML